MNKKIISIASIIFAVIFVAIFLVVWQRTQGLIKQEADTLNAVYSTEYDFDISMFENRVVTKDTIVNLATNIANSGYSQSIKLRFYNYNSGTPSLIGSDADYSNYDALANSILNNLNSIDTNKNGQIRTSLIAVNENGVIDGIVLSDD